MQTITLGSRYKDSATGFAGTATAHIRYLGGDEQVQLATAKSDTNEGVSSEWFAVNRVSPAE